MTSHPRILLIEDDASLTASLVKLLGNEGYEVQSVARGDQGVARATEQRFDLVLTDLKVPGLDGLGVVASLHQTQPRLPIIMLTAHGTTETAIQAMKMGAYDYLLKPCEPEALLDLIADTVTHAQRMSATVEMGEARSTGPALVGRSRCMQEIYKQIGRVAATSVSVLIRGETGTGKELIARAVYQHSDRAHRPFIVIHCAAVPETLVESELFGHERGAFTGAFARRIGRFEQAQGGTVFLDEIGDLSPAIQVKLLRVLQERSLQRIGGDHCIPVDVRILAATHRDLESLVRAGEFREDLFYRLNVATIHLPPLRERPEDVPGLVNFFLQRHGPEMGATNPSIQPEALAWLQRQPWRGNVRELENLVRRSLLRARPLPISVHHLQEPEAHSHPVPPGIGMSHASYIADLLERVRRGEEENAFWKMVSDLEPELFAQAIRLARGNQAQAARWLGVTRLKMREKLSELGLHPASDRGTKLESD